ncbi:FMN-binding negative transcriptional regulator [Stenoxybacter acetivorans]|uniref:FMN-binding negative transcriptional regulator n=1 Tax=Stenoxybacter acetivorans TaxID=422441 RepID=UPI000569B488|nr:FMN-binding negative transcriptional regulator [Stenoxybacter acetivorans]
MSSYKFHYEKYLYSNPYLIDLVIKNYPLALIINERNGKIITSHIPLFRANDRSLFGHADKNNPQFQENEISNVYIVFMGCQSYISPDIYHDNALPTWNYISVHAQGHLSVINDIAINHDTLKKTCNHLQHISTAFQYHSEDTRNINNISEISTLKINTFYEEGRFKLSQEKDIIDRNAAIQYMIKNKDDVNYMVLKEILKI